MKNIAMVIARGRVVTIVTLLVLVALHHTISV
jgi:hypothetical protein